MTDHGNVAFKCTFNDGGRERGFVGFDGTCSNENIIRNIRARRTWCSAEDCDCKRYYENDLPGPRPHLPCYESQLFDRLTFGPGYYQRGDRTGEAIPMKGARVGKIALLTTRTPARDLEADRIVFGLFRIARIAPDRDQGVSVVGDRECFLRLPQEPPVRFWRFKAGAPDWRTGLFRFVTDQEVSNLLWAVKESLRSPQDRLVADRLLACCGSLPRDPGLEIQAETHEFEVRLKYGPGGEGDRHRRLKEFITRHPERLGAGRATAADAELGVDGTRIGAHQVLKYRALMAGHRDDPHPVRGYLVAYAIPPEVQAFCARHDVACIEVPEAEVLAGPRDKRTLPVVRSR